MSYKVGDTIQIKKQETTLEQTFNDILSVLRSPKMKETDKLTWCSSALSILEEMYKKDELGSVKVAKHKLIPILITSSAPVFSVIWLPFLVFIKRHIVFAQDEILSAL